MAAEGGHASEHRAKEKEKEKETESDRREARESFEAGDYGRVGEDVFKTNSEHFDRSLSQLTKGGEYMEIELRSLESESRIFENQVSSSNSSSAVNPEQPAYESVNMEFSMGHEERTSSSFEEMSVEMETSPELKRNTSNRCLKLSVGLCFSGVIGLVGGIAAVVFVALSEEAAKKDDEDLQKQPKKGPPPKPENLAATADGTENILLEWDVSINATGYTIISNDAEIATIPASRPAYRVTGLRPGTRHCYTVVATNDKGASDSSEEACATTNAEPVPVPGVPENLNPVGVATNQINLSWRAVPGVTTYIVKRGVPGAAEFSKIAEVPASGSPRYEDKGLTIATQYCYRIAAKNDAGTSADSQFHCANTFNEFNVLVEHMLEQWNALSEEGFWSGYIAWVEEEQPSFTMQLAVAAYLYSLATKSLNPILNSLEKVQAQVDAIVADYNAFENTAGIYNTISTLDLRGQQLGRDEKLNVLVGVIGILKSSG